MARVLSIYFQKLPAKYRQKNGLTQLLKWAYGFSPHIALDKAPPSMNKDDPRFCGLNIDISGSSKLFSGEQSLISSMLEDLTNLGIKARLCIAPTLGAAWAISRHQEFSSSIISQVKLRHSLAPLPLAALRLRSKEIDALTELNIRRIKHLLSISTSALKSRFSQEVVLKLHQALGSIQEVTPWVRFSNGISSKRSFLGAGGGSLQSQDALLFHTRELLIDIVEQCRQTHECISELVLKFTFVNSPSLSRTCSTTLPTDDIEHLWKLLAQIIETTPVELGVQELSLHCLSTEVSKALRSSFIPGHLELEQTKDISKLLDSLSQHLGVNRVCSIVVNESHIPECSFNYLPEQQQKLAKPSQLVQTERPSMLFTQARPIRAMAALPDSPPFWILWNGKKQIIRSSIGPERITPEWWGIDNSLSKTRDYFRIQLEDGLWLWIYREVETHKWFLHGIWS